MKVKELIEELSHHNPDDEVLIDESGSGSYGGEETGYMGDDISPVESVRKIEEGVYLQCY